MKVRLARPGVGNFASHAQTNGLYVRSESFAVERRPLGTLSLMHGGLPSKAFATIITRQQPTWLKRFAMQFPVVVPEGQPWPAASHVDDRVEHVDGRRYVIQPRRSVDLFFDLFISDLPVYKEVRGRVYGLSGIIASAQTFDPKNSPVDNRGLPCNDVSRFASTELVKRWGRMCEQLRARTGKRRIGEKKWLQGAFVKTTGMHPKVPDFAAYPLAFFAPSPEWWHIVVLNSGVHLLWFVKQEIKVHDQHMVHLFSFLIENNCLHEVGRRCCFLLFLNQE